MGICENRTLFLHHTHKIHSHRRNQTIMRNHSTSLSCLSLRRAAVQCHSTTFYVILKVGLFPAPAKKRNTGPSSISGYGNYTPAASFAIVPPRWFSVHLPQLFQRQRLVRRGEGGRNARSIPCSASAAKDIIFAKCTLAKIFAELVIIMAMWTDILNCSFLRFSANPDHISSPLPEGNHLLFHSLIAPRFVNRQHFLGIVDL